VLGTDPPEAYDAAMPEPWVEERPVEVGGGRVLLVRQAGDPHGRPLVWFHGTPGSRMEPAFAADLCAELGIRVIGFDRPGYGGSPTTPFSLSSIAHDTAAVADTLGIETFATTGHSGGGPFSLACAALLGDRIIRAGSMSGAAPFQEVPELLDLLDANDTLALSKLPDEDAAAAQFAVGFEPFRALARASDEEILETYRAILSPHDGELLHQPSVGGAIVSVVRTALVLGTEGGGWDNVAWVGPWGFDLAAIACPVNLWYGGDDPLVPAMVGPWLEERIPGATLVLRHDDGHLGVMEHTREILETLAQ
jgi:pimeloyl-ACP methyl ester carboxylesterase